LQTIDRMRHYPTEENAKAAKRAFLWLAKRHHPDQGGSHQGFLRVKDAYDQALSQWRRRVA
jgi:curved DNA-binding protein CbpA